MMPALLRLLAFLRNPVAGWTAAADELWAAAAWPRDGAQRLADAEAEREVAEPTINSELKVGATRRCANNPGCDASYQKCIGFCWTWVRTDTPLVTDGDRLDQLIALLEDVRNLLQHNDGRGRGKDVGQRAERSSGAARSSCPTSPSQTQTGHPLLPPK